MTDLEQAVRRKVVGDAKSEQQLRVLRSAHRRRRERSARAARLDRKADALPRHVDAAVADAAATAATCRSPNQKAQTRY